MRAGHISKILVAVGILLAGCGEYAGYREEMPKAAPKKVVIPDRYQAEYQELTEEISSYHKGPIPENIGPDHAILHRRLAMIYYAIGEWQKAHENLERSINMHYDNAEAHLYLGRVLSKMEKHAGAIREFEIALQLDPGLIEAHRDLADAYTGVGMLERAEEEYQKFNHASAALPEAD
jgi:tetratricopeptide (TPR) repeat protein